MIRCPVVPSAAGAGGASSAARPRRQRIMSAALSEHAPAGAWGRTRSYLALNPLLGVELLVVLILAVLILYPAWILFSSSFRDQAGGLTSAWYVEAYTNPGNYRAILNTLIVAGGTAVSATVFGTFMAWAVVRTDMPGRRIIEAASIVPFISTPFIGALAWVLLAEPAAPG